MTVLFKRHFQVAYLVDQIDAGMAEFANNYAIRNWHVMDMKALGGADAPTRFIALAWTDDDLMVELIEPDLAIPSIYSDWRPELPGPRFHHLGFLADSDAEFAAVKAQFAAAGCLVASEGSSGDLLEFAYIDTTQAFGHFYELVYLKGEGRTLFFAPVPVN